MGNGNGAGTSHKIGVVIPTLNEASNLPDLVGRLATVLPADTARLLIVDDNSSDGTAELARALNDRYGNILLHHRPKKMGIGSAVLDGMKLALSDLDIGLIVTMDADLSHSPEELPALLASAEEADFVQGSRYIRGGRIVGWSKRRQLLSRSVNIFYGLLFRTGLKEHTTYYRVFNRDCAEFLAGLDCNGYELGIAAILAARDEGYSIKEVPITFTDRVQGHSKLTTLDLFQGLTYALRLYLRRLLPQSRRTGNHRQSGRTG